MATVAFHAALKAFGGWPGLAAFYFVGLAFPFCFALRTFQAHAKQQFLRQNKELRTAAFVVVLSAILSFTCPSKIYLQRHISNDRHLHARCLDVVLAVAVTGLLAPLIGMARLRRTVKADRDCLALELPDPRPSRWTAEGRRLVGNAQARYFTESAWLLLFTLWFVNLSGGLLTVCIGQILKQRISWWHFPLYNIGGHVAILHAICGVIEVRFHPFRVKAMEGALECESREERDAFWQRMLRSMRIGQGPRMPDLESGLGFSARSNSDNSQSRASIVHLPSQYEDDKASSEAADVLSRGFLGGHG